MSKNKLRSADYSINEIVKKSSYNSFASKEDMSSILKTSVRDLHKLGYMIDNVKGFKPKHIFRLVEKWQEQGNSIATIKNRLSKFRKLSEIIGNDKLVRKCNSEYKIGSRKYYPDENKAIHSPDFNKCNDELIRLSMEGQFLFGLRREEAIKIQVHKAHVSDKYIRLDGSWTKGGIERIIPISNQAQREWLSRAKDAVAIGHSLMPDGKSYRNQLNKYTHQTRLVGLNNLHGLRHAYAQNRYKELTTFFSPDKNGWDCPFNGGLLSKEMNEIQRSVDLKVRLILTRELGHSRLNILKSYLG